MSPRSPLATAAALAALLVGGPAVAAAKVAQGPAFTFDQPAQPLSQALLALSRRTGVVVLAPAPLVAGRPAPALRGSMPLPAALATLLGGAPLSFTIGPSDVVTIVPRQALNVRPAARPPVAPPPGRIEEHPAEVTAVRVLATPNADQPAWLKRRTPSPIDILTEDEIARSGALSLGDALRDLPGAAALTDGGETRQIAVRGVASRFTRVRINGMETLATFGGANAGGGTNRARAFDYNVFAADLFKQIRLQKTASADVDEGSLGSTVDIRTRSPFDLPDGAVRIYGEQTYNSRSDRFAPRGSVVLSRRLADDRLGVLVSAAYSRRYAVDAGSTAGGWQSGDALSPGFGATTGGASLAQVNAALHARIPRLELMTAAQSRLGLTADLDWRPSDRTRVSLDLLYATLRSKRDEFLLESFTFRTAGACARLAVPSCGLNAATAINPRITALRPGLPVLIAGTFDGVDVKSEARHDELDTIFRQITLSATQQLSGGIEATAIVGFSRSDFSNAVQSTLHLDQYDVRGFSYDFRDPKRPYVGFGSAALGDPSAWALSEIREDPNWVDNSFKTAGLDFRGGGDGLTWQAGALHKDYRTQAVTLSRSNGTIANINNSLPAALSAISATDYVRRVGAGISFGAILPPSSWLAPDIGRGLALLHAACKAGCNAFQLGPEPVAGVNYAIAERDDAAYFQLQRPRRQGRRLWGDVGLRLARTAQDTAGLQVDAKGGLGEVRTHRAYTDLLPSANLVWEVSPDLAIRLGAVRVMSRPDLRSLRPGYTISTTSLKVVSAGAPDLKPTRADNLDLALDWLTPWGGAVSLAAYRKAIDSTVQQTITRPAPFSANPYGLPDNVAILACGGVQGCDPVLPIWQFVKPANSGKGRLNGVELSMITPLGPVGSPWRLQGSAAYTRSKVRYHAQGGGFEWVEDAMGGPRLAGSLVLTYQDRRLDARIGVNHRSRYFTAFPSSTSGDAEGVAGLTTIDASARYHVSGRITLTVDASNLTNAREQQFIDRAEIPNYQHRTGRDFRVGARFRYD